MTSDDRDRRHGDDRRAGGDRRTGHDRRAPASEDSGLQYVGPERRSGKDRRHQGDRRTGFDRRAAGTPREQVSRALDLVAYVAESAELPDEERRALDSALLRLRFALSRLEHQEPE